MCKYKCTLCGRDKFDRDYQPHICNGQFRKKLPKFTKVLTMRNKMHLQSLKIYQSRRFYIDEHPEQKELRKKYFEKKFPAYTFTFWTEENGLNIFHYFEYDWKNICVKNGTIYEEPDLFFINRFLKRN